ncbi:MSCRAMM family protein [Nocardia spumae]|uniref:MSCRAMM family protein n=1 Tax=Nocardia spumae TaxID=2887190 RepID=UPI001D13D11E|nr:carboxypeptidase-like regulatory domain-containing protein [Nocardia spumae]
MRHHDAEPAHAGHDGAVAHTAAETVVESLPQPTVAGPVAFGRVRDTRGAALPDTVLTLISTTGRQIGRTTSAADGYFELTAPEPGSYVLIASTEGRRPGASTVALGALPVPCDVVLTAMAGLTGIVTRDDDGAPVPDARVSALDNHGDVLASAATDGDGEFGLPELPEGDVTVAISAAGFHPSAVSVRASGSDTARLAITLHPSARVRGVVQGSDGRPLPDARVTLTDWVGNVVDSLITGPDGSYAFADLDEGTYTLVASGYAPVHNSVVVRDQGRDLDIELGHGVSTATEIDAGPVAARHSSEN